MGKRKVFLQNFGCRQNFADGERILQNIDFEATDDINAADLIIYNTCAVRESAEKKAFGMIGELLHIKEKNPDVLIAVCGCMAQIPENAEKIRKSYKQVDIVFGTKAAHTLPELIKKAEETRRFQIDTAEYENDGFGTYSGKAGAFLRDIPIMNGCDNFCSYCIVPYVRGREVSRPKDEILSEVKAAAEAGVREIMLLGQNVNSYGKGLTPAVDFAGLLRAINDVPGDFRVRFMSPHPKDMSNDVIEAVADCGKICKFIHLPLQSGSNRILSLMNRRYTKERFLEIVAEAREKKPYLAISTDIIVGFPGETEEDFCDTLDVVRSVGFSNIFTFIYSKRGKTKAAELEDPTPYAEKQARMKRLLSLQREVSTELFSGYIGKTLDVLFESVSKREGFIAGKSEEFIIVEAQGEKNLIGQIGKVTINKAYNWALEGKIINLE
jgi:tRNA-2-methylthio-N6-dimethylallyladenosine synthase